MESVSRIIVLLLAVALILALSKGGWKGKGGVSEWLKAKFVGSG
jgi:hypothetical protein